MSKNNTLLEKKKKKETENNACWQRCGMPRTLVHCRQETELLHDPVISLLGISLKEFKVGTQADIFTPLGALFTMAKCKPFEDSNTPRWLWWYKEDFVSGIAFRVSY